MTGVAESSGMSEAESLGAEFTHLVEVIARLRVDCPWDARQTHETLVRHLIEECAELVDAIETGTTDDLREELGDVLMQVVFHAQIASEDGLFTIDDVAQGITTKLVARHPHVFGDAQVPDDLDTTWEIRKRAAKHRESCLDGIADSLSSLARAAKVAQREHQGGPNEYADHAEPITSDEAGHQMLDIVRRAEASGVDVDQALRHATREWESHIHDHEGRVHEP